jgi:hypothetical protein
VNHLCATPYADLIQPQPGKYHEQAAINPQKGEEATRKKSKIIHVFCVSKSAPCNSLQMPAAPRRRTQNRGVFPPFLGTAQGASEIFQIQEISMQSLHKSCDISRDRTEWLP